MLELPYTVDGDAVTIKVVETVEDLRTFVTWVSSQEGKKLAVDTETTGTNAYAKGFRVRTVQIGDERTAWVFPIDERSDHMIGQTRSLLTRVLSRRGDWLLHNAPFDALSLYRAGLLEGSVRDFQRQTVDTYLMAHLLDARGLGDDNAVGHSLKGLSSAIVDLHAADTQSGLIDVFRKEFKKNKDAGWAAEGLTFNETYLLYAGLDVIYTSRLYPVFLRRLKTRGLYHLLEWEHDIQAVTLDMEARGVLIDVDYTERLVQSLLDEAEKGRETALGYGVENINSTQQVADALVANGVKLTEKTPSGKLAVGAGVLLPLAGMTPYWTEIEGATPHPLASAIVRAKRADKWRVAYAEAFLHQRDEHDRVHPGLRSLAARTARMCLPETEKLVTNRGTLHIDNVRVGDYTIGRDGNWTRVNAVHRYAGADVVTYRVPGSKFHVSSTPEHRWLWRTPRGVEHLAPISTSRPTLIMAPPRDSRVLKGTSFIANTDEEKFASLVALLATDGRLYTPTKKGEGLAVMLYQTERKAYHDVLKLIPEGWLSYDRITNGEDHHEIGLRVRRIRPMLEANGLVPAPGSTLKQHPGILDWVRTLSVSECAAFVQAAYVADGATSSGNRVISAQPSYFRDALQLALYRCGVASRITAASPGEWSTGPRYTVGTRKAVLHLRGREETHSTADVWCVSTDDETFTASGEGWDGMYLTGNSIANPPLQQLPAGDWRIRRCFIPDPGNVFISSDFAQIELRVLAASAGVEQMIDAIETNVDLHNRTASLVWPDWAARDNDDPIKQKQRKIAKNVAFGYVYGAGARKTSETAGISFTEARKVLAAFENAYPELPAYNNRLQDQARGNGWLVVNSFGREMPVSPNRMYTVVNYATQGTARDVFAEALLRVDEKIGGNLSLVIHDEILHQAPLEEAKGQAKLVQSLMQGEFHGVPIASSSDILYGGSWGSGYDIPPEFDRVPEDHKLRKKKE